MKYELEAKRLRESMNEININAAELSILSGVSKSSISHYYNGNNRPNNIQAFKLAQILHVAPEWLMGFDVPKQKELVLSEQEEEIIRRLRCSTHKESILTLLGF